MSSMLYFAYGSNMLESRLQHASRGPSARMRGIHALRGHRLHYHKRGRDGSGKCSISPAPDPGAVVWGVLYELDAADLPTLDSAEDVPDGYARTDLALELDPDGEPVGAFTYVARPEQIDERALPFDWYKGLVVAGALEHGLPAEYVRELQAVPSRRDEDPRRRGEALALLGPFAAQLESGRLLGPGG
jgi:hypothetical protein